MKYQPPFVYGDTPGAPGIHNADPDADYANGDPSIGQEGSYIPCEAVEHVMRELVHLIDYSTQTPDHTDLEQVRKAIAWMIANTVPVPATAPVTVYVRADGNDANDGTANTAGGAFLTIQAAINALVQRYAPSQHLLTVQVGDGSYAGAALANGGGGHNIRILGNITTPGNVVIDGLVGASAIAGAALCSQGPRLLRVAGVKMQGTYGLLAQRGGAAILDGNSDYGVCTGDHNRAESSSNISFEANYRIVGGAVSHFYGVSNGSVGCNSRTITIVGTPAFSAGFAVGTISGVVSSQSCTFSGAATGPRYLATANGTIYTNGGGANYFPGDSAGSAATGGEYL
jgi:hypothetical protein